VLGGGVIESAHIISYSDSETYTMSKVNRMIGDDLQLRLQNLQLLLQRILHFYEVNNGHGV